MTSPSTPPPGACSRCGEPPSGCECCTPGELQVYLTLDSLRTANVSRAAKWNGSKKDMLFAAVELAGEVGKACNAVTKLARLQRGMKGESDTTENLAKELGGVVICADLLAIEAGIDLGSAVAAKFNATSKKHGFPERLPLPAAPPASPSPADLAKLLPPEEIEARASADHAARIHAATEILDERFWNVLHRYCRHEIHLQTASEETAAIIAPYISAAPSASPSPADLAKMLPVGTKVIVAGRDAATTGEPKVSVMGAFVFGDVPLSKLSLAPSPAQSPAHVAPAKGGA